MICILYAIFPRTQMKMSRIKFYLFMFKTTELNASTNCIKQYISIYRQMQDIIYIFIDNILPDFLKK